MENWKTMLLLVASCQGILLSLALITSFRNRAVSSVFLGLILLIISLELLNDWAIQIHYHQSATAIPFWLLESYLIIPPSLYFFILSTTRSDFQFTRKHLVWYIPAIVEILIESMNLVRFRITGQVINLLQIPVWFYLTELLPILWMVGVLIFYGYSLRSLTQQTKDNPKASRLQTIKLYSFFVIFTAVSLLWIADALLQLPVFTYLEGISIVFLFALGYTGYSRTSFFDITPTGNIRSTELRQFTNYDDTKELPRLTELLEQEKLYIQPKLSLEDLANALNLPARYVSYLINTYHTTNFHSFINTYRVQEVLRKINDPAEQHKTLLALALESGFNSKSSFNQVFKLHTGQSPSAYLPKTREKV